MRTLLFVALVASSSLLSVARPAAAQQQVSDADRAAARDLFFEGVKLQNDGKFPDALDRFNRAQRIFSAPTHLLHIAECQIALGQLVEGSETYRTLAHTPLPPNSPQAFTTARDQGAAELQQVEPRIPLVKIDVTPANVQNMQVQIDGQPMNSALVGVMRPIDPGSHKVVVFAPGYGKQEAQFAVKERDQKTVPIALQATGGVVYGPAVVPPPGGTMTQPPPPYTTTVPGGTNPPPGSPPGQNGATPGATPGANQAQPGQPAAGAEQQQEWTTTKKTSSTSLLVGARLGVMFPAGTLRGGSTAVTAGGTSLSTNSTPMSDVVSTGAALGIEGGIRFARRFYAGLGFEHGFYGKGDKVDTVTGGSGTTADVTTTISSNLFDVRVAYISNPDGVGFYGEIGVGYRWLIGTQEANGTSISSVLRGGELGLGAGMFIKAGNSLRIIPKVNFGVGSFSKADATCSGNGCGAITTASSDINDTGLHTFIFLGVGGYYNLDFGH
jgi:hypothetical protein